MSAFEPKLTVVFRDGQTGGEHAAIVASSAARWLQGHARAQPLSFPAWQL